MSVSKKRPHEFVDYIKQHKEKVPVPEEQVLEGLEQMTVNQHGMDVSQRLSLEAAAVEAASVGFVSGTGDAFCVGGEDVASEQKGDSAEGGGSAGNFPALESKRSLNLYPLV